jgi:hypothetical protein
MENSNESKRRTVPFKRNIELEHLLASLNESLSVAEDRFLQESANAISEHPIIFVMGPLRSGTTLFMQWLASSGTVAYPTNLLSRFYGAPAIGAQIQLLLTDPRYEFRNEITEFSNEISFQSENGKTTGALAPNEFWYFWRRFLPFQDLDWLPDEELHRLVDKSKLRAELAALTRVFDKPFALKAMILNYNIPFLDAIFEKAVFVQLKRDTVANVSSVLDARELQLGSREQWYSFKIPEYPQLEGLDAISQAAGQVVSIDNAVTKGMAMVDESKKLVVKYEKFCENPRSVFSELLTKLAIDEGQNSYAGPERFKISRSEEIADRDAIEAALESFTSRQ